jgi:hypothetical protein
MTGASITTQKEVTNRVPKKKNICIEKMNLMLGERTIVYTK